jgi:pimeloyl-ACP methyl ester carboxylesterase
MDEPALREIALGELTFEVLDEPGSSKSSAQSAIPVLLLHGFPQDLTSWDALASGLREAGYRTIRPNLRGYSPGARPVAIDAYRMRHLVDDVLALADALAIERCHVIGHDWGGALAWAVASEAPERVATLTVLSTPYPSAMTRVALRSDQGLRSWYMAAFQLPSLPERLLQPPSRAWSALMRGLPSAVQEHYTQRAAEPGALSGMLAWYRAMGREMRDPSLHWHRIKVPTLYCWGARDPALGAAAARATRNYVTGPYTFLVLPEHGHWLPERAADCILPSILAHISSVELPHTDRDG